MEGVTPLAPSGRVTPSSAPRAAPLRKVVRPSAAIPDTLSDHPSGTETLTEFQRNGISRMTLRKLRRGYWPLQDSLDLHGLHSDAARRLLLEFLHQSVQQGMRCVSVVHGKGWHTQGGEGILKTRARHWLTQCPEVLAFCEAPQSGGGSGAVWVLLKTAA
jgi:DNA-nicking Smr family endonuclease